MANTYLSRTMGTPTSRKKFTISVWVKKSAVSSSNAQHIWNGYYSTDNRLVIYFQASAADTLGLYNVAGGSATAFLLTTRKFRDTNGWYHIYYAVDTTQSTASDRIKLYVNGVQETSFSNNTYPSQNADMTFANGYTNYIGKYGGDTSSQFNGAMSHFYYVDGSVIDIAQFGSTDATTGEWKINTSPTISSYGTNGFLILKDGNTITDQSPNSNNFSSNGDGVTKTEDNPSNVFATWNVLDSHYFWGAEETSWATNGNTKARSGNSQYSSCTATLGASSGKYYWEVKLSAASNSEKYYHIGIKSRQDTNTTTALGVKSTDYCYKGHNGQSMNNNSSSVFGDTYQVGDIVGVAMDLDNNKLYFHKNGTYQNSGVPTSGSTGTGAISLVDASTTNFGFYVPAWSWNDGSSYGTIETNFGNGYFGTTAVSSAGTNASGIGIFEYDVPTGYTALCTKGLNL